MLCVWLLPASVVGTPAAPVSNSFFIAVFAVAVPAAADHGSDEDHGDDDIYFRTAECNNYSCVHIASTYRSTSFIGFLAHILPPAFSTN